MEVTVKDGLAGRLPRVDTDVKPSNRRIRGTDALARTTQNLVTGPNLITRKVEIVRNVPLRHNQRMQVAHWEGVPKREGKLVLGNNSVVRGGTKRAAIAVVAHTGLSLQTRISTLWRSADSQVTLVTPIPITEESHKLRLRLSAEGQARSPGPTSETTVIARLAAGEPKQSRRA